MSRHSSSLNRQSGLSAFAVIAVVLLGFLGQLVLQGCAYPDESPRGTIERLTGIDIAPSPMVMATSMPGMTAGAGHHHHHHSHDGTCPLCPLLQLLAVILTSLPLVPTRETLGRQIRQQPGAPRAPPAVWRLLPPSRGPPRLA